MDVYTCVHGCTQYVCMCVIEDEMITHTSLGAAEPLTVKQHDSSNLPDWKLKDLIDFNLCYGFIGRTLS
jgi:hypothetical protein